MKNKIATPLGNKFSIAENKVSQCDEQTFGPISEFRKAGAAEPIWLNLQGKSLRRQKRFSANLLRFSGATRKHARSPSPSLLRTWSFNSTKEDLKKSSLGVV